MKVALVYDRVNKWGGAERVLLALHEMFPKAPLYTSLYDDKSAPWAKVFPKINTSFLQKLPFAKSNHEFLGALMPLAFESFDFSEYDLVISVTSEAAKGIITRPPTKHICICLTPTRYLWSGYDFYFKNPFLRFFSKPVVEYLRSWDKIAAKRPDKLIAISSAVRNRIKKYYGLESEVIYPPVDIKKINKDKRPKSYYLVVSRLVPYKKVELAVLAFNKLGLPLVIVGTGSEEFKLKFRAGRKIKFAGQVSEKVLEKYFVGAKALIMPQEEDFGLVAVEAQVRGVPVIAYKKGGVLDTVIGGKTGIFFEKQTTESLIQAIAKFQKMKFDPGVICKNAMKFSSERFKLKLIDSTTS